MYVHISLIVKKFSLYIIHILLRQAMLLSCYNILSLFAFTKLVLPLALRILLL